MTPVDVSGTIALGAIGLLTVNLLLGLLLSVGYNPKRQWPRRAFKLFTLHNWTGWIALVAVILHAGALLLSTDPAFRLIDILYPVHSPVQPFANNLGAFGFYLLLIVLLTSWKPVRSALGRHLWKPIHFTTYAAAAVFFTHGVIADPLLQGRPVDFIDAEKVYVEACAALVAGATIWRIRHRRASRRAGTPNAQRPTPNVQRPTSNAQRPTPNAQRPTPNAQRPTPNAQRPTPNAQRPTPNAQRPTPNAQRPTRE